MAPKSKGVHRTLVNALQVHVEELCCKCPNGRCVLLERGRRLQCPGVLEATDEGLFTLFDYRAYHDGDKEPREEARKGSTPGGQFKWLLRKLNEFADRHANFDFLRRDIPRFDPNDERCRLFVTLIGTKAREMEMYLEEHNYTVRNRSRLGHSKDIVEPDSSPDPLQGNIWGRRDEHPVEACLEQLRPHRHDGDFAESSPELDAAFLEQQELPPEKRAKVIPVMDHHPARGLLDATMATIDENNGAENPQGASFNQGLSSNVSSTLHAQEHMHVHVTSAPFHGIELTRRTASDLLKGSKQLGCDVS